MAAIHVTSLSPRKRPAEPPLIAVKEQAAKIADRLEARRDRLREPGRRDDLPAIPGAAIKQEPADLGGIARAEAKAKACRRRNLAVLVFLPFPFRNAQRFKQHFAREFGEWLARYALNDIAEQIRAAAIVIPDRIGCRGDGLCQHVANRIRFASKMRFVVCRIGPGARLVPLDAR